MPAHIVVIGAGVSGLTTALQLARTGKYAITVVAKHMPGDYDIEYASPWAGANYLPVSTPGSANHEYERNTWPELQRLASELPEAGVHFQNTFAYRRAKDSDTATGKWTAELIRDDPWFQSMMPNFRKLSQSELPPGIDGGSAFTSVCINVALYLPWLASQCLKHGVVLRRGIYDHVADAAELDQGGKTADLVINCTGLSSLHLGGVEDSTLYPARGQIVIVANEAGKMVGTSGADFSPEESTYVMQRAAGGGTILGGCLQAGKWESQPDPNMAVRIMQRSIELCPSLVPNGGGIEALQVVRHVVGLRPMRKDGIRVEKQVVEGRSGRSVTVVHNYGHGGYGYQTSWGAAKHVEDLVVEALPAKARL